MSYVVLCAFTKPPLLRESRLTGGSSPNLEDLLEWKVTVEWKMVEEVSMNWIGRRSVTELEVSLNWMKLNKQF